LQDLVIGGRFVAEGGMEGGRQEQAGDAESEQTGAHLGHCTVVNLLSEPQPAKQEAHAQDQTEIDQN
jgi:hypothetical protein